MGEKGQLIGWFGGQVLPALIGIFEELKHVEIAHQVIADHTDHIGESPAPPGFALDNQHQQLCD